jgi:hypothetical protein
MIVGHRQKRRLLDQHVFAGPQGLEGQVEVKPRWDGHDHSVNRVVGDGGSVVRIAAVPLVPTTVCVSPRRVAAGITRDHDIATSTEVAAVDARDEAASEKSDVDG